MRHAPMLLVLGLFAVGGCFTPPPQIATAWRPKLEGISGPDAVCMDIALIEAPLGDRYLNHGVWTLADEQLANEPTITLEHKSLLERNGWRVGKITGAPPDELLTLLTSERSCANPRHLQARAGTAAPPVILGPLVPQGRFEIQSGDDPLPVTLDQAQFTLEVTPTLQGDGRVKLRFNPLIRHGETQKVSWKPNKERTGWAFQMEQPTERYPNLGWEVALSTNDLLLIGGRNDRPNTIGHQALLRPDESPPLQRLLVVRTRSLHSQIENWSSEGNRQGVQPLAAQASASVVRGVSR